MTGIEKGVTVFLGGLIAVAITSTLVSNKSETAGVVNAAGGALSGSLSAAQGG